MGNVVTVVKEHNHSKDDSEIMAMKLKAELKKSVAEKLDNIRSIYNSIASTYPQNIQNMVPWKSARSSLYKVRKTSPPTLEAPGGPENRCNICLPPPDETWVFDLCGHYPFCGSCSNIVVQNKSICPICRNTIVKRMRLYHS